MHIALRIFLVFIFLPGLGQGESFLGKRLKVIGEWDDGQLTIDRLKYKEPTREPERGKISGRIAHVDQSAKSLLLGPLTVKWTKQTQFVDISEDSLVTGTMVKAIGVTTPAGYFLTETFKPAPPDLETDEIEITATVTSTERQPDGLTRVTLMEVPGLISTDPSSSALQLTRKQDDERPEDQLSIELFGRPVTIGGEFGLTTRYRRNFRLDRQRTGDRVRADNDFQLELFYPWSNNFALFVEGTADSEVEVYRKGANNRSSAEVERGETWAFWGHILESAVSLQVGRQNYEESREWWWDEDLDSIRVYYSRPFWHFELGVAQRLGAISTKEDNIDPEQKDVLRVLAHSNWNWAARQELAFFFLHQEDYSETESLGQLVEDDDRIDPVDGDLTWVGLRSTGKWDTDHAGDFEYWTDTAWVGGKETLLEFDDATDETQRVSEITKRSISGWALDVGLTWEIPLSWQPALTIGYARGSREFRQTGLQGNNDKFTGVDRFRYYGELLRPELANLQIWTFALGFPLLEDTSVELLYHFYQQVDAQDFVRDTRISADPTGRSRSLGHELDLVVGIEEWENLEIEFVAAVFRAESAFGSFAGNTAVNVVLKMDYNF